MLRDDRSRAEYLDPKGSGLTAVFPSPRVPFPGYLYLHLPYPLRESDPLK